MFGLRDGCFGVRDPACAATVQLWRARHHTIARHGPVQTIEPLMVFEIGFEAIQSSPRHKSGIALRFPRILRVRKDKKPADADRLATMRALLDQVEAMR